MIGRKGLDYAGAEQFRVNEAWIAVRVNEAFLFVQDDPYDIYVLMDAASTYVLGHVLSKVVDEKPEDRDIEALFYTAWAAKKEWAKKLIVSDDSTAQNAFRAKAEEKGLSVATVPLSDLEPL